MKSDLKVLFFDVENIHLPQHIFNSGKPGRFAPRPAGFCGDLAYLLVFGYKWLGDDKARYLISSKKEFKEDRFTDKYILKEMYEILSEADVLMTWYGAGHDFPFVTSRLAQAGMYLDQNIKHIDLMKTAKKALPLSSNRLNNVAKFFGKEVKIDIPKERWAECWMGKYEALEEMALYCAQDVEVLEQVYHSLKPLIKGMPDFAVHAGKQKNTACPVCTSDRTQSRGRSVTKLYVNRRYQCQDCGTWYIGERISK